MLLSLLACGASDGVLSESGITTSVALPIFLTTPESESLHNQTERALAKHIRSARETIDVAVYDFGLELPAQELAVAADNGVTVRVVTDGDEMDEEGILMLQESGIEVVYRPEGDRIMHHKFAVVDGQSVWTGSTNWTETGTTMNNNHAMLLTSTELADRYTDEFEQMFFGDFGSDKEASNEHSAIALDSGGTAQVWFSPQDEPVDELLSAIAAAESEIYFMIFSFTRDDVVDALVDAQDRGVNVLGIFDESQARMSYSVDEDLADAGVPVYIDGNDNTSGFSGGKLHHKVMIIDPGVNNTVITGSMNWSTSGNSSNDENLLVLQGTGIDKTLMQDFCQQLSMATKHDMAPKGSAPCRARPPVEVIDASCPADGEDPASCVIINEFLPNPSGSDRGQEFVEIVNTSEEDISLEGWSLSDEASSDRHVFSGILAAGAGLVVFDMGEHDDIPTAVVSTSTYLSLNNSGDTITLHDASGEDIDVVSYTTSADGVSWNRERDGLAPLVADDWTYHDELSTLASSPGTLADGSEF
ncbi:MAG: phospholipase D-like domain-containing protein [Myxococcota bacterium]|nr:phospholipase D-like domain-containing protein [Myxococcota bacterium]